MRYTTIIDISEFPMLYRNVNARLLYLHLCLRSGYHDYDRDIYDISLRRLADEVGLTLSATRHALKVLGSMSLISMEGSTIKVKKWIADDPITKRARTKAQQIDIDHQRERQRKQEEFDKTIRQQEERKAQLRSMGKTDFMIYYESLEAKASQGDLEALRLLQRHRATYELHQKQFQNTK